MFNRILVTMDNSDTMSQSTFDRALVLAKENHARLMLLHVLPSNAAQHPSMETLQLLHKTAKTEGLASDVAQLYGDHDHVICDLANRWGADLILLGQHDSTQNDSAPPVWFAEQSPCSVLLAQTPNSLHLKASKVEQFAMMA